MKQFITFLSKKSTLIITTTLFGIVCILANTMFQSNITYLTQTYHYGFNDVTSLLTNAGSSGILAHKLILIADFVMVICYTCFLLGINYRLSCSFSRNCHFITIITFIPLLLSLTQMLEIVGMVILLFSYPEITVPYVRFLNTLTMYKYYFTPVFFVLPFLLFGIKIVVTKRKGRMDYAKQ